MTVSPANFFFLAFAAVFSILVGVCWLYLSICDYLAVFCADARNERLQRFVAAQYASMGLPGDARQGRAQPYGDRSTRADKASPSSVVGHPGASPPPSSPPADPVAVMHDRWVAEFAGEPLPPPGSLTAWVAAP